MPEVGGGRRSAGALRTITASFTTPPAAGAYSAGDNIANSLTASAVVPLTFQNAARSKGGSGRVTGAKMVVTPASGNLVIVAAVWDLLLFRPAANIPFAAGGYPADNAVMAIPAAALRELVGVFAFVAGAWRAPIGSVVAAGSSGFQDVGLKPAVAGTTIRPYAQFDLAGLNSANLIGVVQAQGAWTPGAVANTFDVSIEVTD